MLALLLITAAVVLGVLGGLMLGGAWRPRVVDRFVPSSEITKEMASFVGLVRRKGETSLAFRDRVLAAHRELSDASTEFMNAAKQLDSIEIASETYRSEEERVAAVVVRGRSVRFWLPRDHPAAVRYARAKRGDSC